MPLPIAQTIVWGALAYFAVGLGFAVAFVTWGVVKVDPAATSPSLLLRLLWIPGSAAFWPLLLRRWMNGDPPPTEATAHREAANSAGRS